MTKRGIVFIIIISTLLIGCNKKDKEIDISEINLEINIHRLDQEIFEIAPGEIEENMPGLIDKYGEFFELYGIRVINLGSPYQSNFVEKLTGFTTDYTMNTVNQKVMEVFPDLNKIENSIENAFKRYHHYFPEKLIPAVYTYIGGFNQSIVVSDSILAIGTDKYLGQNCEFYDRLGIANYMQINMNPENIPTDAVKAWVLTEFEYNDSIDNLINNMVYQGKIQYILDLLLPNTPDSLKFGFTGGQIRWCAHNEKQMWDYLIENKLLFSTDYMTITKHINPAPFTSGYPRESPGRASVWLGWQIVKKYMDKNSGVTLNELMLNDDYQKILTESRYEPK